MEIVFPMVTIVLETIGAAAAASVLTYALALTASLPVSIFITVAAHELGHAICGSLAGYTIERIAFGSGRRLLEFRVGRTEFQINRGIFGGQVQPGQARDEDCAFCQIIFSLGGILANVMLILAAGLVWLLMALPMFGQLVLGCFALINALYVLEGLMPYTMREDDGRYYESDAYQILRSWRVGPDRADQNDYMIMVTPYFASEYERAPSRAAREMVQHVRAIRSNATPADTREAHRQCLIRLRKTGRLTQAEDLLVLDVLDLLDHSRPLPDGVTRFHPPPSDS